MSCLGWQLLRYRKLSIPGHIYWCLCTLYDTIAMLAYRPNSGIVMTYEETERRRHYVRPRALTQACIQTATEQSESFFMTRLPAEIRLLIYEHYCGNAFLTMEVGKHVFRHVMTGDTIRTTPAQKGLLSLPLTFRLVHVQPIDYLYSHSKFHLTSPGDILALQETFLYRRFEGLTSIEFSHSWDQFLGGRGPPVKSRLGASHRAQWEKVLGVIAPLQKLQKVRVEIGNATGYDLNEIAPAKASDMVLEPLMQAIRRMDAFDVVISRQPWNVERWFEADVPLRLHYPRRYMNTGQDGISKLRWSDLLPD